MKKFKNLFSTILVLFLILVFSGCGPRDNEFDYTDLSVRDFISENGMVSAASPHAAKVGLDILKEGGNAFDAAVAVAFALGVVEPNASGIGGGGMMVGYEASTGDFLNYDFREFVPGAGNPEAYSNQDELRNGSKSIGVPLEVDGLLTILENHGNLSRQEVIAPSIKLANEGVEVTPELAGAISNNFNKVMTMREETTKVYTSDGITPLEAGEILRNEDLGKSLQIISDEGKAGFYTGYIANQIVDTVQEFDGLITHDDLQKAMNSTRRIEPVQGTYRGYNIISSNTPTSGGISLIEMLNMLELYGDISKLGHNSAEYVHLIATVMQLAYGDKRKYIADPNFVDVPLEGLLSKSYASTRLAHYNPEKVFLGKGEGSGEWGNPWAYMPMPIYNDYVTEDYEEHYSTTHFVVADKEGNIVSITKTINYFFGSGLVARGTGIHLNNNLSSFSLNSSNVAYVQPYKKPVSHMTPTIILKDGMPFATLGTPGGMRIPGAVLQVVLNLIDFDMDIQSAIEANRVYSYAMNSPEVISGKKLIDIERGFNDEVITGLEKLGYEVVIQGSKDIDLYFGGVHGIVFTSDGKLHGGADTRRDGKALGY